MEQPLIDGGLVRKYLLGELAEDERERIEVSLLTSDDFYEALTALEDEVEDELIDQYVGGELSDREREKFEHTFLIDPERAEKLRLIVDLDKHAARASAARGGAPVAAAAASAAPAGAVVRPGAWWQRFAILRVFQNPLAGLACAVALIISMLGGVWLLLRTNRLEAQLAQLQARERPAPSPDSGLQEQLNQLHARNEELSTSLRRSEEQRTGLEQEVASLKDGERANRPTRGGANPPSASTPIYSAILAPVVRNGSVAERPVVLPLPANAARARLFMGFTDVDPKNYRSFQVVVETRDGREAVRSNSVTVRAKRGKGQATVILPTQRLPPGEYTVEFSGITPDGAVDPIGLYILQIVAK